MTIRQGFRMIAMAFILLLAAIFYLMILEVRNQRNLELAEDRHQSSYRLADELRQSSDDLTRMARTYVVTSEPIYRKHFDRILAIRNGTAPRPVGYEGVYWDFVTAGNLEGDGAPDELLGKPESLQDRMRRLDFTDEEFAKLRESQTKSDALVSLEAEAMAAVEGLTRDSAGDYTVQGEPNLELARELLHGQAYHRAKAEIMRPIEEFTQMVGERTARDIQALHERSDFLARSALGLIGLFAILLLITSGLVQWRILRPVRRLGKAAARAEQGDYSARLEILGRDEIGHLTHAFNQMSIAIESDIAQREQTARDLAQAQQIAENANRAKSVFLANMSHELRTPMNAILGYSEMLIEDAEDGGNQETVEDLQKIHAAGTHLLALINDVLDLSKIEAGKMDVHTERFDLPSVIDEVATTIDSAIQKNGNQLSVEIDPELREMNADVTKVRQVLFNLLSNAAKFTHEGQIRLLAAPIERTGRDWVEIVVSDSGIGIPADKLEHVFEEFSQADERTTRDYGGTGLGLPISRRFCEMMGGEIDLESTPGEGSTFTVRLPRESVTSDTREERETTVAPAELSNERTILIIDDDPSAQDLLSRTIQGAGARVVTASDGEEGLRIAQTLRPVAITLDVMMPGMDGWEVLEHLKADPRTRDIPVLMVTMTDDRSQGYALGATEFLTKPVTKAQLIQLLKRHAPEEADRTAMVVDDLLENREILRRALEEEGWQVMEAENGRNALELIEQNLPSLILLDLMMPVMDGFEFVHELRKSPEARSIPIVVVTAKDVTDEDRRRLNGGVVGLIERRGLGLDALLDELRDQLAAADSTD